MRYQDYICDEIAAAAAEAFRYAKAVPADKVNWKAAESSRSVLDIAQELAKCPDWAYDICNGATVDWSDEAAMAADMAEMASWQTVEQCEQECNKRLTKLAELFKGFDDAKLDEKKWLPYDGGREFTMVEMMNYPRWNFNYHTGQIAYVQTLYGDREMH